MAESPEPGQAHGCIWCGRQEVLMTRDDAALKDWCRSRIHDRYREAYRLTLEVGVQAEEKEDLSTLAQTMDSLDPAIEVLEPAGRGLVAVQGTYGSGSKIAGGC